MVLESYQWVIPYMKETFLRAKSKVKENCKPQILSIKVNGITILFMDMEEYMIRNSVFMRDLLFMVKEMVTEQKFTKIPTFTSANLKMT